MRVNVDETLEKMSLRDKLAQLMMIDFTYFSENGVEGELFEEMNSSVESLLSEYPVGAIALFASNCRSNEKIVKLVCDMQKTHWIPKYIGIDQEGGIVYRLKEGTKTPGNMALGRKDDVKITRKMAEIMSLELSKLGINLNFAPDVDVNSNPKNPIIGVRSFSEEVEVVSRHSNAYIDGMRTYNVLSCAKHFPGHGNTVSDSHLGTTYTENSLAQIETVDIPPFKATIEHGVEMIMTAHIIAKDLDNSLIYSQKLGREIETPATLSKPILTQMLRNELGFRGIILTDALVMKAIEDNFTPVESTLYAIKAGADMAVMPLKISNVKEIEAFKTYFETLYQIAQEDGEFLRRIDESCRRILEQKVECLSHQFGITYSSEYIENCIREAKMCVGTAERQAYCDDVANTLVVYHPLGEAFSSVPVHGKRVLVVAQKNLLVDTAALFLENLGATVEKKVCTYQTPLDKLEKEYDIILVVTYNLNEKDCYLDPFIASSNAVCGNVLVISARNPYDRVYIGSAKHVVECFGVSGFDQTNAMITQFTTNFNAALRFYFQ